MADISQVRVNNTDYNFADDTKVPYDLLQDTVGFTSKNLLTYPYGSSTASNKGITYTDNGDGTWTLNGTATAVSNQLISGRDNLNEFARKITSFANQDVIISDGLNRNDVWIQFWHNNGGIIGSSKESDAKSQFTIPTINVANSENWNISLMVANGTVLNNVVVKPMLRKADIMDSTYEQYRKPVPQYIEDRIKDTVGFSGKNLLQYPYDETTKTSNGITWTDNGDGTVTANGTATANSAFQFCASNSVKSVNMCKPLIGKRLTMTGCPSGGGNNKYMIGLQQVTNSAGDREYGDGYTFTMVDWTTLTGEQAGKTPRLYALVFSGQTVSNLTFKPMLRLAEDLSPTYEPYHIPGVVTQEAQNVLGAKNLIKYPYSDASITQNGITFTANNDGSVTINGTATGRAEFRLIGRSVKDSVYELYKPGNYIMSFGRDLTGTGIFCQIGTTKNNTYAGIKGDFVENNTIVHIDSNMSDEGVNGAIPVAFYLVVHSGETVNNLTVYPMFRLADIKDDTYVPYAKTNRNITEMLTPVEYDIKTALLTAFQAKSANVTGIQQGYILKYGKIVIFQARFDKTANVSMDISDIDISSIFTDCGITLLRVFFGINVHTSVNAGTGSIGANGKGLAIRLASDAANYFDVNFVALCK